MSQEPENTRRKRIGRVTFFACKPRVQSMLDQGYPLNAIYEELSPELAMSYSQFTRYVKRFLAEEDSSGEQQNQGVPLAERPPPADEKTAPNDVPPAGPSKQDRPATPFFHDPNAGNSREDLI